MKLLVYGSKGWIGTQFMSLVEKYNTIEGKSRLDNIDAVKKELKEMNRGKEGHRYVYPESFMEALGYCHLYLHLLFRQTEGLIKSKASCASLSSACTL